MDVMLPTTIGKLRILCSLPLFSDAICIRSQSAAEHAFTNVLLSIALSARLKLPTKQVQEAIELAIFAEVPKAYLGDPSFYLRQRHPEVQAMYREVRGRLWRETEEETTLKSSRDPVVCGLHALIDSFAAMLFIEKESLLGNGFFQAERYKTHYHSLRRRALAGESLRQLHPTEPEKETDSGRKTEPTTARSRTAEGEIWKGAVGILDELFDQAYRALREEGIGSYSATFVGMLEKLKEHFRYKGWSFHYEESVGEHTYQVVYICRFLAEALKLSPEKRIDLYRAAAFHDLAEAYASDVIYPVKVREKDLGDMHAAIEDSVLKDICAGLGFDLPTDAMVWALVDIADRFSAQIYFDRERRSGNSHFDVPNVSMERVTLKYRDTYPQAFEILNVIWGEYTAAMNAQSS